MAGMDDLLGSALPTALLLYWGLAAFAATVALLPLPFASGFRNAVALSACRGKLLEGSPRRGLGLLSDWTVPQRWFAHFYALGAAWNAVVALLLLRTPLYAELPAQQRATLLTAFGLLQLHLQRRLLETLALMRYPPAARMHGLAYVFGLSYYLLVPLTLLPPAAYPALYGEALQLPAASSWGLPSRLPPLGWVVQQLSPMQLAGAAVFLVANALQLHTHQLLAGLATRRGRQYKIPHGGAFRWVSCPHYLAEMLIYGGLLLLSGGRSLQVWLMLGWVVSNLLLAAGMTHEWYHAHFKTYPRARRAVLPFLY